MNSKYDINNKEDFEKIVIKTQIERAFTTGDPYQELYRGQSNDSYVLKSSITRYVDSIEELKELENNIISDFKKNIENNISFKKYIRLTKNINHFENEWRWIEQIQQYRLPTRLLDWTLNPKIALFFAVESNQSKVGQFWIYKSPLNWTSDDHFGINPFADEINLISNSSFSIKESLAERRRSFQSGKFTFQDYKKSFEPMERQELMKDRIFKYTINPKSKQNLLEYLSTFNVTQNKIYVRFDEEIETLVKEIKEKYNLK